jgi:probable HAF family extracellular repeat protein
MSISFPLPISARMRGKLCMLAAALVLIPAAGWSQQYTLTDLGTLGGASSLATSVNNLGQVAGQADTSSAGKGKGQADPFLYSRSNGKMVDLGNFGGYGDNGDGSFQFQTNIANALNDDGVVVGAAYTEDGTSHPFLWNGGSLQDLAPGNIGAAVGINSSGVAVGFTGYTGFVGTGEIFNGPGDLVPTPAGGFTASYPEAINDAGAIAANCWAGEGEVHDGCLIDGTKVQALVALSEYTLAYDYAINNSGTSCGQSFGNFVVPGEINESKATAWIGDSPVQLAFPPNTTYTQCNGLDDYGQFVGNSNSTDPSHFGFPVSALLWDPVNGVRDLNKLVPPASGDTFNIEYAVAISNTGYIAANCVFNYKRGKLNGHSETHACLLTPKIVPVLKTNVHALALGDPYCIQCTEELEPEANSLPDSLAGISTEEKRKVIATVGAIERNLRNLSAEHEISESKATLLLHDAQLVENALDILR